MAFCCKGQTTCRCGCVILPLSVAKGKPHALEQSEVDGGFPSQRANHMHGVQVRGPGGKHSPPGRSASGRDQHAHLDCVGLRTVEQP